MYAFLIVPGVAPCLPNILCGGRGEFGLESNRLQFDNPRVLKTTWTPPGASHPLDVVVKFMTKSSYGKKAQELAGRFAPTLHYYGHIDEGFYVAVMDLVPGQSGVGLNVVHEIPLQELRQHLKDNDIVHGDLRPQNLVFGVNGSVKVLDWDWGGVRSTENPRYPMAMNPGWKWHEGATGGALLEHDHDCYELDKLHAEIDKMKMAAALKRKAEEDAPGAEERRGSAPTSR
ncbi:hypothetical protein C8F01DRAFT_976197 [Mycena amicta]|nr:hypothetical protein C8F01DRAFT_976197 [Mycena amicta]